MYSKVAQSPWQRRRHVHVCAPFHDGRHRRTVKRRKRTTSTGASERDDDYTLCDDRVRERKRARQRTWWCLAREKRWNTGVGRTAGRKRVACERKPLACTAVRDSELQAGLPLSRHDKTIGWDNTIRSAVRFPPFYILWRPIVHEDVRFSSLC